MRYISESDIKRISIKWHELVESIEKALTCLNNNDFSQPVKPYLRYGNSNNRIIAMPAFVGGEIQSAGIKWIASFPNNLDKGLRRANSITILNDPHNGIPIAVLNTPLLSIYRTVAVSGVVLKSYFHHSLKSGSSVLIIGLGPIGEHHYFYLKDTYADKINKIFVYDISTTRMNQFLDQYSSDDRLSGCTDWQSVFEISDIVITCTVVSEPFIDIQPKRNSLHLNVSLRDYDVHTQQYFDRIIVDNWEEVCREGTYIERLNKNSTLQKNDVNLLSDIVLSNEQSQLSSDETIIFCPMGLAIFDIAISQYYLERAKIENIGHIFE
ncbi:2,3-diaminopropionate biosynthesis protein SbnB [Paenibacillus sp. NPDC057967]|uniref:2,3-diaminopropionate biosynthesis protein SbnB n=1 Tax=Paenibacillus sp. NPDC057967 TaxID=3346293 RepID=UPI0036D7BADC